MIFDISYMVNVAISVSFGSIVATLIIWKLIGYFARKTIHNILDDKSIAIKTETFIKDHIVLPFNKLDNNSEIKTLIRETTERSLEIYLKKLKEQK